MGRDRRDLRGRVRAVGRAALGAALLAGVGTGAWASAEAAGAHAVRITKTTEPTHVDAYDDAYARFRRVYPALQGLWAPDA